MKADDVAATRARLDECEAELGRLRARYEVLMNAFRFEAAKALVPEIEAAERECAGLVADLPSAPRVEPAPFTVAARHRRRR